MTPERWQRVKQLFNQALELTTTEREAALARADREDPALRAEVEALLAADEAAVNPLENPVSELTARLLTHGADAQIGRRIGRHRLQREIGRGGMGTVYLAVRDDGQYQEQVAIKLIQRGMDTDAIIDRFLTERQILADLDHPNIARLLDGGITDNGLPYFVMEYIEGVPIDVYCDTHRLTITQRLKLFQAVCAAVHAAHRRLIVHCDLKPTNILVTEDGATKLVDFGVAKLLDPERDPDAPTGADRLLTPGYASPEQIRGEPLSTASDVYSLGVVLYLLLTGSPPYDIRSRSRREMERLVCEVRPELASTVIRRRPVTDEAANETADDATGESDSDTLEQVSRNRSTTPGKLGGRLAGDLDSIALMALRKEPERRYGSVEQLAEDLRRHLAGLPVLARQPTLRYRAGKFLRRHGFGAAATMLVLVSLLAGMVATTSQAREARRQQRTAEQALDFLSELFDSAGPNEAQDLSLRDVLDEGAKKITDELADAPAAQAKLMVTLGGVFRSLGEYDRAESLLEKSLAIRRQFRGQRHLDIVDSLRGLGVLRYQQDRHAEGETLLREALAIHQIAAGEPDRKLAHNLNNLALVLEAQGQYAEAEELHRRALKLRRELLGDAHPDIATSINNLAAVLRRHGNTAEAEEHFREALAMRRKLLGPKHLRIASSLNNLAVLLRRREAFAEGETLLREALAMQRDLLGEEHHHIAKTLNNLAALLGDLGDTAAAAKLYRETLAMQRKLLDEDHSDITNTLGNLAVLLHSQGDFAAAEPLHREVLELDRRRLGADHPSVATDMINLASTLRARGEGQLAEKLFRDAVDLRRHTLGARHPRVAAALMWLARSLADRKDCHQAQVVLREREMIVNDNDNDRPSVPIARGRTLLGDCFVAQGRFDKAEPLLLEGLHQFEETLGREAAPVLQARRRLAELYEAWGRPADAKRYRAQSGSISSLSSSILSSYPDTVGSYSATNRVDTCPSALT